MSVKKVVAKVDPTDLPCSLPLLLDLASLQGHKIRASCHVHSSVSTRHNLRALKTFLKPYNDNDNDNVQLHITLIWTTNVKFETDIGNHGKPIHGEVNLARWICRHLNLLGYEAGNVKLDAKVDEMLDIFATNDKSTWQSILTPTIQKSPFVVQNQFTLADLIPYSHMMRHTDKAYDIHVVQEWMSRCQSSLTCQPEVENDEKLFRLFDSLNIKYQTVEHPQVFTVEAMMVHLEKCDDINKDDCGVSKNLFLKDKKQNVFLLSALHNKNVNLNDVAKKVKASGGLRFASEEVLLEKLGVKQGCVTAYALINDVNSQVKFVLDKDILACTKVFFHPLVNHKSTAIGPKDLLRFIEATKHSVITIDI